MSNQSFLVCSSKRAILPSHREPRFSAKQQIIACGDWCVPVLWMALFNENDIKTVTMDFDGESLAVSAPVSHRRFAAKRLAMAVTVLEKTFPMVLTWQAHANLLLKAVEKATVKRPYISIEWDQIAALTSNSEMQRSAEWLMRYFAGLRVQSPAKKLGALTAINWNRKFPNPVSSDLSDADEKNLAELLGNDYERAVPWWPSVPSSKRTKKIATKKTAKASASSVAEIKSLLADAIDKHSVAKVETILKKVDHLEDSSYTELLNAAMDEQTYRAPSKIPEMLIKKGVPVSPQAFATAATDIGNFAQFKAMLDIGQVDPNKPSKTVRSRISAPPIWWAAGGESQRRNGADAARKVKLLLDRGVSVDVKDSTGDWLLYQCIRNPKCLRLLSPFTSKAHRITALNYAMMFRLPPRAKQKEADEITKCLLTFVRAIHTSGITEATGKDVVIQAMRDDWSRVELEPYPYR